MPDPQIPPWVANKLRAAGIPVAVLPRLAAIRPNFFGKITLRHGVTRAIVEYQHGSIIRVETVVAEQIDGVDFEITDSDKAGDRVGIRFEKRG